MPVYSDTHSFECPILEPVAGDAGAYPFPGLRPMGLAATHEVPTVVLENDYLRVAVAPDLGGRIVSLFDKRFQREVLSKLVLGEGRRGARLLGGVELSLDGGERLNAMGPVDFQVLEEEDAILMSELASGSGLSWHMRISLPPRRATVQIAVRVANRMLTRSPYQGGIWFGAKTSVPEHQIIVLADPGVLFDGFRTSEIGFLEGRQVDSWTCELVPSGLAGGFANRSAVCSTQDGLSIEALEPMIGHKVAIDIAGQTQTLVADLYPETVRHFTLGDVPDSIAILSPTGEVKFLSVSLPDADEIALRGSLLQAGCRGPGFVGLALRACRRGELAEATALLEDALTFNGDDPLAWWLKAVLARHLGQTGERSELLNAHFLAPFEPALRAESFLSIDHETKEPSPLVRPLAENPDAMVEVAVLLAEAGLRDDLARWIDECLRHRDVPMLRYILADALLTDSRMEVEAAQHIQHARDKPIVPPYPWRAFEEAVLKRLAVRFPTDARVEDLLRTMQTHLLPKI